MLYAKLEEDHGLVRNAMSVYDRAASTVTLEQRYALFNMYIAKAAEYFGVTKTRDIYEQAINALPQDRSTEMCQRYANLERKLGEIDRARAIFSHAAQFCDPRVSEEFWGKFNDFEVHHGNEDTFRDMLRVKRSVETARSGAVYAADNLLKTDMPVMTDAEARAKLDEQRKNELLVMHFSRQQQMRWKAEKKAQETQNDEHYAGELKKLNVQLREEEAARHAIGYAGREHGEDADTFPTPSPDGFE